MADERRDDDRQAIHALALRYATGIDRRDWVAYRSCFTDPCEFDFSTWTGRPGAPLAADVWTDNVRRTNGSFDATQHLLGNFVLAFDAGDADRASYEIELQAQHFFRPETLAAHGWPDGSVNWCLLGGHYSNHAVRTGGEWRIERCQLTVRWRTGNEAIFGLARSIGAST
jgi:SnoaL-like domain